MEEKRKRNYRIHIRLSEEEYDNFEHKRMKTGLTKGAYIRKLIAGVVPNELPSYDYNAMIKQLRYIGNNINQIALNANKYQSPDVIEFRRAYDELQKAIFDLQKQALTEKRIE